ncbi:MAG: aminotransferase class III-fold pyridoxal phosphate-dependent enzyme [Acidobacteria bacterium]|nr:aminotransferase class III-fold pyridoxal phosphate-dependent enzyme [Acidobacteriota bacterium]MCA1609919.1 aminotransferase class III-fold pyridoxal phosphate-dependent enzyme [Acidobacteriota bacterium]
MTKVMGDQAETMAGPRSRELFARESAHMAPGLQSIALYSGLAMARGRGTRLFDEDRNEYIDFVAGIGVGSVGHCHPHYVESLKKQLEELTFGSFTTEVRTRFLELLATVTPPGLSRIQLFSGGAEAVEAAFRLAKSATRKFEFIGFTGAFHGKTGGVLPLLSGEFKHQLGPFVPGLYTAPYANCYRCPLKLEYPDCGLACVEELRRTIREDTGGEIAAIIIEPIQGTAGNVIPPAGFLPAVREVARENGALFIADEMLTGFGRTGRTWACDHEGIVPDVLTVGKGIGGGFPLAGVVSTDALTAHAPFSNPSGSSSSYGGNPLAAAAGLASLEILIGEKLAENADRVGRVMLARLEEMKERHRFIGDVRGRGLLLGIELVSDRTTKEPLEKRWTRALFQECLRRGLVSMCYSSSIRINPPLVIDEETALEGLQALDDAMSAVFAEP